MGPLERYRRNLHSAGFLYDPAQEKALEHFERVYRALEKPDRSWRRLLRRPGRTAPTTPGVYLWGGVGRGKTQLMDLFCECLVSTPKMRIHFHRFMHGIHSDLKKFSGEKNPLQKAAACISERVRVLCLDEFFVSDIGDAMILGGLLQELFHRRLTLIATSNTAPEDLYRDGLQRQRFLPAIELLGKHCCVMRLEDGIDYRLRTLEQAPLYYCPANEAAERRLAQSFEKLAPDSGEERAEIEINGRNLRVRRLADDVVWFDFSELCESARSQNDYIELAREFHALLLSRVPQLTQERDDVARRFIHLVDILYDRNVKLILSAQEEPEALYAGSRLESEFRRTASRLREMRTRRYLEQPHTP